MKNFPALREGLALAVTGSLAAAPLGADAAGAGDALVDNRGGADAYVMFGGPTVTAVAATAVRIPAGAMFAVGKGSATHVAAYCGGSTTLVIHLGEGV